MNVFFIILIIYVVIVFPENQITRWYGAHKLNLSKIELLAKEGCYRGAYGQQYLSLFTCPLQVNTNTYLSSGRPIVESIHGYNGSPFFTLPSKNLICFVETMPGMMSQAKALVKASEDSHVIWTGKNEFIVASNNAFGGDYPSMCVSSSDYNGTVLNVITIPSTSVTLPPK